MHSRSLHCLAMAPLISGSILLLTLGCCVFGQNHNTVPTPDHLCRNDFRYKPDHIYPDDWHLIVDSYDYEDLFGGSRAVWELKDVDGDRRGWNDAFGGTCQLEIGVGGCSSNQDNWFFTSYNSYNKSKEVILRATFRWAACQRSGNCDNVAVYRYDTDGPVSEAIQTNPMNYKPLTEDIIESRLHQTQSGDTTVEIVFNRSQNFSGFYLGFRDTGACGGQIKRFQAYYRIAPPFADGLLSCPEVPLVKDGSSSADCSCPAHASPVKPADLTRTCDEEGTCSDLAVCECDCGYHSIVTKNGEKCDGCKSGFYHTSAHPMSECLRCPPNTKDDQPQACQCECLPGYFRAKDEGPDDGCTAPPGACTELEAIDVGSNYAVLRWKRPDGLGSGNVSYTIKRSDQRNIGDFEVIKERLESNEEYVTHNCTDLTPATSYVFRVVVHNKVTDMDEKNEHLRLCDVKLTTLEGVPGPPRVVRAFCYEVVWGVPFNPNGKIIGYDLQFYDLNGRVETYVVKRAANESYCRMDEDENLDQEFTHIRVRAFTATQSGEWSPGISLGCNDSDILRVPHCPTVDEPDPNIVHPSQCDILAPPTNGLVVQNGRQIGSSATYRCNRGYVLVGLSNRMCKSDGTWSGRKPVCQTKCGILMNPANGDVSQTGTSFGSFAIYSCYDGYDMSGDGLRMCDRNGAWTGKAPKCMDRK